MFPSELWAPFGGNAPSISYPPEEKFSAGLITAVLSALTLAAGSLAGAREGRVDDTVQYSVLPHLLLLWMNADNNLFA